MNQSASYEVITVDLTAARAREVLVRLNNRVRAIYLNNLSAAGTMQLHVGAAGGPVSLAVGRPVRFRSRPFAGQLAISNAAQAGVIAELVVLYHDDNQEDGASFEIGSP